MDIELNWGLLLLLLTVDSYKSSLPNIQNIYVEKTKVSGKDTVFITSPYNIEHIDCKGCRKWYNKSHVRITSLSKPAFKIRISHKNKKLLIKFNILIDVKTNRNSEWDAETVVYDEMGNVVKNQNFQSGANYMSCTYRIYVETNEFYHYFCSMLSTFKPIKSLGERLRNKRSDRYSFYFQTKLHQNSLVGAVVVNLSATFQKCQLFYWKLINTNNTIYDSCTKIKKLMDEKIYVSYNNLLPLTKYKIVIQPLVYKGNQNQISSSVHFTTTYGSSNNSCFAECLHKEDTYVYTGFRTCRDCQLRHDSNKLKCTKDAISICNFHLCSQIRKYPCIKAQVKTFDETSISVKIGEYGPINTTIGTVILIYNKNEACVKALVLKYENITFGVKVTSLYNSCDSIIVERSKLKYEIKDLSSNTPYALYIIPIISNETIGLVKRYLHKTESKGYSTYFTVTTSLISMFVILSVVISLAFRMPQGLGKFTYETSETAVSGSGMESGRQVSASKYGTNAKSRGKKQRPKQINSIDSRLKQTLSVESVRNIANHTQTSNDDINDREQESIMRSFYASFSPEEKEIFNRFKKRSLTEPTIFLRGSPDTENSGFIAKRQSLTKQMNEALMKALLENEKGVGNSFTNEKILKGCNRIKLEPLIEAGTSNDKLEPFIITGTSNDRFEGKIRNDQSMVDTRKTHWYMPSIRFSESA